MFKNNNQTQKYNHHLESINKNKQKMQLYQIRVEFGSNASIDI